ncbi:MAG: 4'-phosphopantetheinyl transferase family protein [Candidatus Binataceae bacterium]
MKHLLPESALGEVCRVTEDRQVRFSEETKLVSRAVAKRQNEFAAGREAAHRAMSRLGVPAVPLLAGAERAPLWPAGVVGSISHTRRIAIAAVASEADLYGLGVDVEEDEPLVAATVRQICGSVERAHLVRWSAESGVDAAKLIFSAKEAFYKSYYPKWRQFLDFLDVVIILRPSERSFEVRLVHDRSLDDLRLGGRFGLASGHVFSAVGIAKS